MNYNECKKLLILSHSNLQNVISMLLYHVCMYVSVALKVFCKDTCSSCLHLARRQQAKKKICSSYSSININTGSVHSKTDLICTRHENTTTFFPQIRWCRQYSLCDSFMLYSGYMTAIVEQIIVIWHKA